MQAAEKELGLQLSPRSDETAQLDLNGFLDRAENGGLILVLDGPDGQRGALILNTGLVGAVIETMTIGRLSGATPIARRMTRTDAAIVAPLIDAVLSKLEGASLPEDVWCGYRFGATAPDLHSLGNLLDDVEHLVATLEFQVAGIPYPLRFQLAFPKHQSAGTSEPSTGVNWSENLQSRLNKTQISVPVVLCNLHLPYETVQSFEAGKMLPIPGTALRNSALVAGGQVVARGQLGQFNGQRALKLTTPSGLQNTATHMAGQLSVPDIRDPSAEEVEAVGT